MEGREGMALSGSAPYYLHRGVRGSHTGFNAPLGLRNLSNPNVAVQSNVRSSNPVGLAFNVEGSPTNFPQGFTASMPSGGSLTEPAKRKRGRPRKYAPETGVAPGAKAVSLGLSPMSSPNSITPAERRRRGRPPGSGRKQRLATVGEWMSSSAGIAFTPHVILVTPGEDIAAKILLFSQQRPRAICIMSASGGVSSVTLRQPATSSSTVTYEGNFEILCLSGSYLVAETGGSRNRTGGVNVSLSSRDGGVIGVQSVEGLLHQDPFSFVYGNSKPKSKSDVDYKDEKKSRIPLIDTVATNASSSQNFNPATGVWLSSRGLDPKNPNTNIDLMHG